MKTQTQIFAIIVAGGLGKRTGNAIPKQFIEIADMPLLYYSMHAFHSFSPQVELFVCLPEQYQNFWKDLCERYNIQIPHSIINGGEERFFSVKNALDQIPETENSLVAVHDAARPFIKKSDLERWFDFAQKNGNSIPVMPLKESIQMHKEGNWQTVDRNNFRIVQTPQIFKLLDLKKAYNQAYNARFTDDASVMESASFPLFLTEGSDSVFKITTAIDLKLAEIIALQKD